MPGAPCRARRILRGKTARGTILWENRPAMVAPCRAVRYGGTR